MDIHLINLDRSGDRLEEFRRLNGAVPVNFIRSPAVDGSQIDRTRLVDEKRLDPVVSPYYTPGALGCALSHLALWQRAIETQETVTICEDDVIFNRRFADDAGTALAALGSEWDLVMWGWNFNSYLTFRMLPGVSPCCATFDQQTMLAGLETFREQQIDFRLFWLLRSFGTPCYSISPKGAGILSEHCLPLRPMPVYFPGLQRTVPNIGIDIMMNDAYPRINAMVSFPPLVIVKNEHSTSTVLSPDWHAAQ